MQIILHNAENEPQDVWAVFMPSVKQFIFNGGNPYGAGNAMTYEWLDSPTQTEIHIEVWRASDGVHARRINK